MKQPFNCFYPSSYASAEEWIEASRRKRCNTNILCLLFVVAYTIACFCVGYMVGIGIAQ